MAPARIPALRAATARDSWLGEAARCATQEPLFDTRASLASLAQTSASSAPGAVLVGVGLGTEQALSRALPLDILGMLLPAERLRRAVGADRLVVVIADVHALTNGFDAERVERRAQTTRSVLERVRRACRLRSTEVVLASSYHDSAAFRGVLAGVRERAPADLHEYVVRQLAEVRFFERVHGGILKVGWSVGPTASELRGRDEVAFDTLYRRYVGGAAAFAYCRAGRALSDATPKAVPYITTEPQLRVCLGPDERPTAKLRAARMRASRDAVRGVRRHLKAILYTFGREVEPITGPTLGARLETLLRRLQLDVEGAPEGERGNGGEHQPEQPPRPSETEPALVSVGVSDRDGGDRAVG